jgi:membrane-bound inhibitor of C-type lysozyme
MTQSVAKMRAQFYALVMKLVRFPILMLPLALFACQSTPAADPETVTLPALSQYRCGASDPMIVKNNGASVTIVKPSGETLELPAVEPGSKSRFGSGIVAVVFDGRSALFMETGKPPLDCKR